MINKFKFRGGMRDGLVSITWPFITFSINSDSLILKNSLFNKYYTFSKWDIDKIEIKKYFPLVGYGVKISHHKSEYNNDIYFWYVGFKFEKFIKALKNTGWTNNK